MNKHFYWCVNIAQKPVMLLFLLCCDPSDVSGLVQVLFLLMLFYQMLLVYHGMCFLGIEEKFVLSLLSKLTN